MRFARSSTRTYLYRALDSRHVDERASPFNQDVCIFSSIKRHSLNRQTAGEMRPARNGRLLSLLVKFHGKREDLLAASLEQRRIGVRRRWILVRKLRMLMQSREFRLTFFETSWKLDTLLTNDLETSGRGNETS